MRSGGFPCRLAGCDRSFVVSDQSSLDALKAASAERTEHEISAHGYHHVRMEEERPRLVQLRVRPPRAPGA